MIRVALMKAPVQHDHLILCSDCDRAILDMRDCLCPLCTVSYARCGYCQEQEDYDETERKRNN